MQSVMKTANLPGCLTDTYGKRKQQWTLNIVTWNVLSWYRPRAFIHTVQQLKEVRMDMMAIYDIRWRNTENTRMIFYSGNQSERHDGTGFAVEQKCLNSVINGTLSQLYLPLSQQIIKVNR